MYIVYKISNNNLNISCITASYTKSIESFNSNYRIASKAVLSFLQITKISKYDIDNNIISKEIITTFTTNSDTINYINSLDKSLNPIRFDKKVQCINREGKILSLYKDDILIKTKEYKQHAYRKIKDNKKIKIKSNKRENKLIKKYSSLFNLDIKSIKGSEYTLSNYCEHGDIIVDKNILFKNYKYSGEFKFCPICNSKLNNISDTLFNTFISESKKDKSHKLLKSDNIKNIYPSIYNKIISLSNKFNVNFSTAQYMFSHNINDISKCACPGCNNYVKFSPTARIFLNHCEKHTNLYLTSNGENEIKLYLDSLNIQYESNKRNIISNELDIFIPSLNIAIEYNGLFWHSITNKTDNLYHYKKYKECLDKNIKLITIWEDDWQYKKDICKSLILYYLNLNIIHIKDQFYIKEIDTLIVKEFLNSNYLYDSNLGEINLVLYYKDELVSIIGYNKNHDKYKIEYFCNKIYYNIDNSLFLLFNYFEKFYKPNKIEVDINCDSDNIKLYESLGFEYKDIIIEEMVKNNHFKIYNSGKLKYEKTYKK